MQPLLTSLGAAAAVTGAVGLAWVRRRRFSRRNLHGVEVYRSYTHMLASRAVDATVTGIAGVMLCAGGALALFCAMRT